MKIAGTRVHIAGSAGKSADAKQLRYAHRFVRALTEVILREGGTLVVEAGNEPNVSAELRVPAIFDWSVLETVHKSGSKKGYAINLNDRVPLYVVSSGDNADKIPSHRRAIWDDLVAKELVHLEFVAEGWSSGAIRRQRQSLKGDVLICISGGEGVEHLATLYRSQNKPVLALDLNLGSSRADKAAGGYRLFQKMRGHPEMFFDVENASKIGTLMEGMHTNNGEKPVVQVVQGVFRLLEAFASPTVFYVRLLNKKVADYHDVEWFFRKIVDNVVGKRGLTKIQMSETKPRGAWMNVEIFNELRRAAVVIADLTGTRPNCFTEMGYAFGQGKPVMMTFREDSTVPFDTSSVGGFPWNRSSKVTTLRQEFTQYWDGRLGLSPLSVPPLII